MERSEARIRDSAVPAQQTDRGYVDWGSILAGAVIAAGLSAVFTAFGAGVGLGSISAREGQGLDVSWGSQAGTWPKDPRWKSW